MQNQQHVERRTHCRIAFDAPVTLSAAGRQWRSNLLDISLKGALVRMPAGWQDNKQKKWHLDIQLHTDDVHIIMEAGIRHIEADHIGFHCEHIDLDSITNLRHLVELNLADEALLERELSALA